STMQESAEELAPLHELMETEFPGWEPYPWGARYQVDDLIRHILIAQALLPEYAELFRGLDDSELLALADSFALENCRRREPLLDLLAATLGGSASAGGEPQPVVVGAPVRGKEGRGDGHGRARPVRPRDPDRDAHPYRTARTDERKAA